MGDVSQCTDWFCSICRERNLKGLRPAHLDSDHYFHEDCLHAFLLRNLSTKCPYCQNPMDITLLKSSLGQLPQLGLYMAIKSDDHGLVKEFIGLGADPLMDDGEALLETVKQGSFEILQLIWRNEFSSIPSLLNNLLRESIVNSNPFMAEHFINIGAEVNNNDEFPIRLAITCLHQEKAIDVLRLILVHGANPNAGSVLQDVCRKGNLEAATLLISFGATISKGCLEAAAESKNTGLVQYLELQAIELKWSS